MTHVDNPEITVRMATSADTQILTDFNLAMALETEHKSLAASTVRQGVQGLLEGTETGYYLVAESNGSAVASLMITTEWSDWRNANFWWIQSVYVHPNFRRQGIYSRLYHHVQQLARQDGRVCGIRLYVEQDNLAAQATYRKLGMSETPYRLYESSL